MIKLGVTGGIGSGKSSVCKIFECLGVPVFHADEEGRRLLSEDEEIKKKVVHLFGDSVLHHNKLDRKKIAAIVFSDPQKLAHLNAIIHPAVRKAFNDWASVQKSKLIVEEVAILFESGAYKEVDKTLVVTAPEELRIERVVKRDKVSKEEVKRRMAHQWSEEQKAEKADFLVINDHKNMLIPQVIKVFQVLTLPNLNKKP